MRRGDGARACVVGGALRQALPPPAPQRFAMSYTALSFTCPGADADAWGDALLGTGALAVESTDAQAGTAQEVAQFAEPGLPGFVAWPVARVTRSLAQWRRRSGGAEAAAAKPSASGAG